MSHHLVSLRTHWSLVDSSLRPRPVVFLSDVDVLSGLFFFLCVFFFSEAEVTSSKPGDRMLFLTGFPVRGLRSGRAKTYEA